MWLTCPASPLLTPAPIQGRAAQGLCRRLGSIPAFSCWGGERCSPLAGPQGLGHSGPALLGPGSAPSAPTARPPRSHALRRAGSLPSAPFPVETSSVFHLHGFSSFFFSFNIFFNAMFAVRLKSFVGFFVCGFFVVLFKPRGV